MQGTVALGRMTDLLLSRDIPGIDEHKGSRCWRESYTPLSVGPVFRRLYGVNAIDSVGDLCLVTIYTSIHSSKFDYSVLHSPRTLYNGRWVGKPPDLYK